MKKASPTGEALFSAAAAAAVVLPLATTAAVAAGVAADAIAVSAAAEQDQQNDDPQAAIPAKTVVTHNCNLQNSNLRALPTAHSMVCGSRKKVQPSPDFSFSMAFNTFLTKYYFFP